MWCFSQVKGAVDDDVAEADIISTVEFNHSGELLATGDKGGRVVIFQQEQENKIQSHSRGEYNVYSTFQSHEPEFDYLKSLEIEEKINKIRWLPQKNAAQFLLSTNVKAGLSGSLPKDRVWQGGNGNCTVAKAGRHLIK
uniref:Protein phosphatase 2 regulatory subunit Balpha n=1 Tax=Prolemur simus TaxID=1328070 RepID=A0A8C8ZDU1_PROSS